MKYDTQKLLEEIKQLKQENSRLKNKQKYGLIWEDTPEELDNNTIIPVLKEITGKRIELDEGGGVNYLIEGDNYHSLKVLQHTHKGKVDIIYIDPPYNTGNEFVYNDKIVDKEDSFRHSKWLSFMNKRLRLARELMTGEGVIFISIDDNEYAQLKLLCDQIFGEENFISNIVWRNKGTGAFDSSKIINENEYILCYAKDESKVRFTRRKMDTSNDKQYKYQDDKVEYAGRYKRQALAMGSLSYSPSLDYPVTCPDNTVLYPGGGYGPPHTWRYSEDTLKKAIEDDMVEFVKTRNGWSLYSKQYEFLDKNGKVIDRSTPYTNTYTEVLGRRGTQTLKKIMGSNNFSYPKPVELVQFIVNLIDKPNATVLDFFAGSGTTAHAVMELNKEDGGNRSFILCTNNEVSDDKVREHFIQKGLLDKNTKTAFNKFKEENEGLVEEFMLSNDYKELGIARSVTYERNRKVIEGYVTPKGKEVDGIPSNLKYLETVAYDRDSITNPLIRVGLLEEVKVLHEMAYPSTEYDNYYFKMYDKIKITNNGKPITVLLGGNEEENEVMVDEIREQGYTEVIYRTIENYI